MFLSNINLHLEEEQIEVTPLSDAERLELDRNIEIQSTELDQVASEAQDNIDCMIELGGIVDKEEETTDPDKRQELLTVANETYLYSLAKLGYSKEEYNKYKIYTEGIGDALKGAASKIKDFAIMIREKIKALFKWIWTKGKELVRKIGVKLGLVKEELKETIENIEKGSVYPIYDEKTYDRALRKTGNDLKLRLMANSSRMHSAIKRNDLAYLEESLDTTVTDFMWLGCVCLHIIGKNPEDVKDTQYYKYYSRLPDSIKDYLDDDMAMRYLANYSQIKRAMEEKDIEYLEVAKDTTIADFPDLIEMINDGLKSLDVKSESSDITPSQARIMEKLSEEGLTKGFLKFYQKFGHLIDFNNIPKSLKGFTKVIMRPLDYKLRIKTPDDLVNSFRDASTFCDEVFKAKRDLDKDFILVVNLHNKDNNVRCLKNGPNGLITQNIKVDDLDISNIKVDFRNENIKKEFIVFGKWLIAEQTRFELALEDKVKKLESEIKRAHKFELDKIEDNTEKMRLINSEYTISTLIGKVWYVDHLHGFTTLMAVFNKFLIDEYQPA